MADKALYQTKRGAEAEIKAYVITTDQNDLSAAGHLIELLHNQRVEMFTLKEDVIHRGQIYPKGSVYIPLAQPNYAVVQVMLAEQPYSKQAAKASYNNTTSLVDVANICMSLTMGVDTKKLTDAIDGEVLECFDGDWGNWYLPFDAANNRSYHEANLALADGKSMARDEKGNFKLCDGNSDEPGKIRRAKVGLLKLSVTGNEEEGYTRSLLRLYDCDYRIVMDKEIREIGVPEDIDVLIMPGDRGQALRNGDFKCDPAEYQSGLGTDGQPHLREFVKRGGRILAWEHTCEYVNAVFGLGLADKAAGLSMDEYCTAGSQLNAVLAKENHPLTYGMPRKFTLTHSTGPILVPRDFTGRHEILATIAKDGVLRNGITRGEARLAGTPCMLRTKYGEGDIILYTFNPEFRAQQDGTFKLLLNALYK